MKYFLDTEFIEAPCFIDLISIGIVAEDGREFYAESSEVDWSKASQWVLENVKPHLKGFTHQFTKNTIRDRLLDFIGKDTPEFWGYFADYDWVVTCWLFGTMVDLPKGWPMFCRDLRQVSSINYHVLVPQVGQVHNALEDVRWTRDVYKELKKGKWI